MKIKKWLFSKPHFEYEEMYTDLGGPWAGHKYFAYDLVYYLKPRTIVELGTHLGCSLFSFSQAVKDLSLKTKLVAVDTWQGDEHAGQYGEDILNRVKEIKNKKYRKVTINLDRHTFDQSVSSFRKGSIDVLHIDGLHTYEAVKHDFDTWLPKVSPKGIILLHDIAVQKWGFGIYKLWRELQKKYRTIEFTHSYGLGVVFLDPKMYQELVPYIPKIEIYYMSLAENRELTHSLINMTTERDEYRSQLERIHQSIAYKTWHNFKKLKNYFRE